MWAWGSPGTERAPRKLERWGAKQVDETGATHDVSLQFPAVDADRLQNLFHFDDETYNKNEFKSA